MESNGKKMVASLLVGLFAICCLEQACAKAPAAFVFGDSLVDPGNNNYLRNSLAKANYLDNGVDFKAGPTGRFCNGKTVVDVINELAGVPYSPPYLNPSTKGAAILQGVSYASGAGGILDSTGFNYIQRIGMNQQVSFFRNTVSQINSLLGPAGAADLLSKSLFSIVIGSNDYINNYLHRASTIRFRYTPRQYSVLLINTLAGQLTTLYNLGARRFLVAGVGPIGCIPDQMAKSGRQQCVEPTNALMRDYNAGLKVMLRDLNNRLGGATFLYANVYDLVGSLVANPGSHGLNNVNEGCCGGGLYKAQLPCLPRNVGAPISVCSNRNEYLFWDPFHTTEAANVVIGSSFFHGGPELIEPMNISQLLA